MRSTRRGPEYAMTTTSGCNRRVHSSAWDWADCGKPVKDEGLCASHLAGKKRSDAATAKGQKMFEASGAAQESAVAIGRSLAVYGILSTPDYSWGEHRFTGKVVVDGEAVLKALKDMGATR